MSDRNISANTSWLLADRVIRAILTLLVTILMARNFGPDLFGTYSFALAVITLALPLSQFGINKSVVRDLVSDSLKTGEIVGTVCVLRILFSLLTTFSCVGISFALGFGKLETTIIAILSLTYLFSFSDSFDYYFQSKVQSKYVVLAKLPAFLLASTAKIVVLVSAQGAIFAIALVHSAEYLIAAACLTIAFIYFERSLAHLSFSFTYAKSLLKECWPLFLSSVSIVVYMKVDLIMLKFMSGEHAVGIYSAASRVSEGLYFIATIIVSSYAPRLISSKNQGDLNLENAILKLGVMLTRIAIALSVILVALSPVLFEFVFGREYLASIQVFNIHVWASIAVYLGVVSTQYLIIEKLSRISFYRTLLGMVVNVLLNLALIPAFHEIGAAIASLISYFLATFSVVFFRQSRDHGFLILRSLHPSNLLRL